MKTKNSIQEDRRPILLVGGGTGGHITPLVAVGEELTSRRLPFVFVGSTESREEKMIGELGWPFFGVMSGKWRRYGSWSSVVANCIDAGRVIVGFFQALRLLGKLKPKLIFSKGGAVAVPVLLAAKLRGLPIVIHESDAVMGLSNRLGARFARRVLTNFSPSVFPFADRRYTQVGMPIRRALRQAAGLKAPRKARPLILVLPGSQGSTAINSYIKATLGRLLAIADVIHLTGEKEYEQCMALKNQLPTKEQHRYKPYGYIDRELPLYFQMADLLVTRASATTTAEAALFRKPVFLIPLPTAAGNHQVINAKILERAGAAVVKEQHQLTPELFATAIEELLSDSGKLDRLGQNLHDYFDEAGTINKVVTEITNG